MAQVVYYGSWDNRHGLDIEPLKNNIQTDFLTGDWPKMPGSITACPAFKDYIKNVFIVKSPYQYEVEWTGDNFKSSMYDQEFFDAYINARSMKDGYISLRGPVPVFISESDDLLLTQEPAIFHNNDVTQKLFLFPGTFNIGKHFPRTLEFSGKFKQPSLVKIGEEDAMYYVRFHTNEDIIFKKFIFTTEFRNFISNNIDVRKYTKNYKPLQWWYNLVSRHNYKKFCLDTIKKNLI